MLFNKWVYKDLKVVGSDVFQHTCCFSAIHHVCNSRLISMHMRVNDDRKVSVKSNNRTASSQIKILSYELRHKTCG